MSQDYQLAWPSEIPEMGSYAIVCLDDQRVYVGQSRRIWGRWKDHLKELRAGRGCPKLQKAWDELGGECFDFRVLEEVTDPAKMAGREQHFIDALGGYTHGFNTLPTAGSFEGYTPDAEARAKIGAATKKRFAEDPTLQPMMVEASKNCGYTPTERHARRIGEAHKGMTRGPMPEEQRVNIMAALAGRTPEAAIEARTGATLSDEHKRKIGEANRGRKWTEDQKAALRGRVVSEEHKSAISKAMRGRPWSAARRAAHEAAKRRKARGG